MKIKFCACIAWIMAAMAGISLSGCGDTRPIPGDLILTTYNSEMEATKNFSPMDTLYIKVAGMSPNSFYQVSALDADGNLISRIEARTDENGVIDAAPLWYDIGVKGDASGQLTIESFGSLTPVGFKVNVKSLYDNGDSTDFTQEMFIIFGKADTDSNPKPVIYSCYTPDGASFHPENAFKETGTLDADGLADPKTKVYVKADRVPLKLAGNVDVTKVDFYVLRFTGEAFQNGDALYNSAKKITGLTGVDVVNGTVPATLLWDLNTAPKVTNPTEDTMAYSIVMDVDRDGVFDAGVDTNSDGVSDYFTDGVDGNGLPGFIIQNTPANDLFVTIKDGNGNIVNSIPESGATALQELNISIDNVPVAAGASIKICLVDAFSGVDQDTITADQRTGGFNTITVDHPDTDTSALRYLPYIKGKNLLTTRTPGDTYQYAHLPLTADTSLDLVVDMDNDGLYDEATDYLIKNAVTVLNVEPPGVYTTCSDTGGTAATPFFDETHAEGNTVVYLKAENAPATFDVYVMKNSDANGLAFSDPLLRSSLFSRTGLAGGTAATVSEIWDLDGAHQVINPGIDNNTYTLVVDDNRNGIYDVSDKKLTIVILNTNANSYPRVSYVNIASGGSFGNTYTQHWTKYSEFCDYRDVFVKNGLDTNRYGGGYGVKAVFNPYFSWFDNPAPQTPVAGLYYGVSVDVYIVNAETFDLADYGHAGELNDAVDVTGRHSTLAVQPSCYNGAGMMTIWPAQMVPGRYHVIVDVNRNGRIDEGTDIIDAVNKDGKTIEQDPTVVGFTVE